MNMADQVRQAVRLSGVSMYEIARDSGLTRGALSRFMAGQRDMNLRTLQKIAPTIGLRLVVDPPKRFDRELTTERRKVR